MILGFCQWMLLAVHAQISLELEWKERRYLPKEDFMVKVRLINFSGQNLEIGNIHNWLRFEIETKDGHFIKPLKILPTQGSSVVLSNSREAMIPINLTQHFDIVHQGKYLIQAAASFTKRSEERRVGKECRSRWSPCHSKKKKKQNKQSHVN